MNHELKKLLRIIYGAILAVIILFFIFDFYPMVREANYLKRKIKTAKMVVKTLSKSEVQKQLNKLQDQFKNLETGFAYIQRVSGDVKGKVNLKRDGTLITLELEDLAEEATIEMGSVKPLDVVEKDGYLAQNLQIGLQGDYTQLVNFLTLVENSSAFMSVNDLVIKKSGLNAPLLDINLTLNVVYSKMDEKQMLKPESQ